jgi:hypothetical protein
LGQVDGRTAAAVTGWLAARGQAFREAVQIVALDPSAPDAAAVRRMLPQARIAVDHFHVVLLANQALTRVRQRVTRELLDRRGRAVDPVWANRRLLLRGGERLSPRALARMSSGCIDNDPTGQILTAWIAREELRRAGQNTLRLGGSTLRRRTRNPPPWLGASGAGARLSGSEADDEQTDAEDEDNELEGDGYGVLEAPLQALVTDGEPYDQGQQATDHEEHPEPARDEAAHDSRRAQEQQGHPEQDPEVALEAPLDPASGFGIGKTDCLLGPRRGGPSVYCLLEGDAIHRLENGPRRAGRDDCASG